MVKLVDKADVAVAQLGPRHLAATVHRLAVDEDLAARRVIETVAQLDGLDFEMADWDLGAERYLRDGVTITDEEFRSLDEDHTRSESVEAIRRLAPETGLWQEVVESFEAGAGNLDECNGRMVMTPEFPEGTYAYFLTREWPVIPRCYAGTPEPAVIARSPGGGGRGGRPGRRGR